MGGRRKQGEGTATRHSRLLWGRADLPCLLNAATVRVFARNFAVCGVRKGRRPILHRSFAVARCTVGRLEREVALAGVIRAHGRW